MKLVANFRASYFNLKNKNPFSKTIFIKIVNSDDYGSWTRLRNIINKHYVPRAGSFMMRKSKIVQWLEQRYLSFLKAK